MFDRSHILEPDRISWMELDSREIMARAGPGLLSGPGPVY